MPSRRPLLALSAAVAVGCAMPVDTGPEADPGRGEGWLDFDLDLAGEPGPPPIVSVTVDGDSAPPRHLEVRGAGDWEIGLDPGGTRLWWRWIGDETWWESVQITGVDAGAESARLLPYIDDRTEGIAYALLFEGRGWLLSEYSEHEPRPLEVAPRSALLSETEALEATVTLRLMSACPTSHRSCLLFGRPEDVQAAVDPSFPTGGWGLSDARTREPLDGLIFESTGVVEEAPELALSYARLPDGDPVIDGDEGDRLFGDVAGGRGISRVTLTRAGLENRAFDLENSAAYPLEPDGVRAGVARDGERLIVWMWAPDWLTLGVSVHDVRTGARIGEPLVVSAWSFYEIECGNVYWGTRPIPVIAGDRMGVALYWGGEQALYFERAEEHGRFVQVAGGAEIYEPTEEGVPPFFVMDEEGALR